MDPVRIYDYLTRSRGMILDRVRPLSPEQYVQQFPIGLGSLARTLTHVMISEWFYIQRLLEKDVPPYSAWAVHDETPPPFAVIDAMWAEQARATREAIASIRDWDAVIEYRGLFVGTDDQPRTPATIISASASDIVTQLILHEVHHRAQAMNMLRQLGITAEVLGDIDFNALMYRRRTAD